MDDKNMKYSIYCVFKEIMFPGQIVILIIIMNFSAIVFCYKHYKYYLMLRDMLDKGSVNSNILNDIRNKKKGNK